MNGISFSIKQYLFGVFDWCNLLFPEEFNKYLIEYNDYSVIQWFNLKIYSVDILRVPKNKKLG